MNLKSIIYTAVLATFFVSCKTDKSADVESKVEDIKTTAVSKVEEYRQNIVDYSEYDFASLGIEDPKFFNPLQPGSKAPNFLLNDDKGNKVALSDLVKEDNVAVIFYRGYWCPACNKHLQELTEEAERLEEAGIKLVAITPESYEDIGLTVEKTGAEFLILSDPNAEAMKNFGVAFEVNDAYKERLGKGDIELNTTENGEVLLPVPATFIINSDQEVIYTHFDPKYQNRASVEEIIAVVE